MYSTRKLAMWLVVGTLAILSIAGSAWADLGWTEDEYAKRLGPAGRSPLTPNEARFPAPGGGSVVVIFADGQSREEVWLIERDASFVPAELMQKARAAVQGKPVRRVEFRVEGAPAAEIFQLREATVTIQVDYRNGGVVRVGQCRSTEQCTLLDRLLAMERQTDDLMARTQAQMRREAGR